MTMTLNECGYRRSGLILKLLVGRRSWRPPRGGVWCRLANDWVGKRVITKLGATLVRACGR